VSTPFVVPEFDSGCLSRNTGEAEHVVPSMNGDRKPALHRVDVNRFFLASDRSSEATDSPQRYVDDGTGATNDDPTATSYVRLDALRMVLAVIDFFVVLHRCACLGASNCRRQSDEQLIVETISSSNEVMRNGVAGSGIVLCSKHHDATRLQRKHRIGRSPNGSVSRPVSSFDVYDIDEDSTIKATLRSHVGGGGLRCRWTPEQRRRRRQLASLLVTLVLCSMVVSLVYIVVHSLDAIFAELLMITTEQCSDDDTLVTETFLSKAFAYQVCYVIIYC